MASPGIHADRIDAERIVHAVRYGGLGWERYARAVLAGTISAAALCISSLWLEWWALLLAGVLALATYIRADGVLLLQLGAELCRISGRNRFVGPPPRTRQETITAAGVIAGDLVCTVASHEALRAKQERAFRYKLARYSSYRDEEDRLDRRRREQDRRRRQRSSRGSGNYWNVARFLSEPLPMPQLPPRHIRPPVQPKDPVPDLWPVVAIYASRDAQIIQVALADGQVRSASPIEPFLRRGTESPRPPRANDVEAADALVLLLNEVLSSNRDGLVHERLIMSRVEDLYPERAAQRALRASLAWGLLDREAGLRRWTRDILLVFSPQSRRKAGRDALRRMRLSAAGMIWVQTNSLLADDASLAGKPMEGVALNIINIWNSNVHNSNVGGTDNTIHQHIGDTHNAEALSVMRRVTEILVAHRDQLPVDSAREVVDSAREIIEDATEREDFTTPKLRASLGVVFRIAGGLILAVGGNTLYDQLKSMV